MTASRRPCDRPLFDRVAVVDWSAASRPRLGGDSIWIATVDRAGCAVENLPTRHHAERRLSGLLADRRRRTLLGVDFSLGYPPGTAAALGLGAPPWRAMWELLESAITDDERNRNNRFRVAAELNRRAGGGPGPFWGRPAGAGPEALTTTKVSATLPEWRAVEDALRADGRRPFSSWQLLGAGCVGSQSLVGIPVLERLRRVAGDRLHVWPFTTGLAAPPARPGDLVVAEVWPTLVDIDITGGRVRDAVQVEALATHLHELDRRGRLATLFAPSLDAATADSVVTEEGWVLGAAPMSCTTMAVAGS